MRIVSDKKLRETAVTFKAGMRSLDEGYDPHMPDVTELVRQAWDEVWGKTIARCWLKAYIFPSCVQVEIHFNYWNVRKGQKRDKG